MGVAVCVGVRVGPAAASGAGVAAGVCTRNAAATGAGAGAAAGFSAIKVQPPAVPIATAVRPPSTKRVFDPNIAVPFLAGGGTVIAVVLILV